MQFLSKNHLAQLSKTLGSVGWAFTLLGLISGCAIGPDYLRPTLPESKTFGTTDPVSTGTAGALKGMTAQRFVEGAHVPPDWWTAFGSAELNRLVERAFVANPNIESAHAALRAAQENVSAQRGYFFPTVQTSYSPARTKLAGNQGGNSPGVQGDGSVISTTSGKPAGEGGTGPFNAPVIYNFHTAQLTVGFNPDVFGVNRRLVESLQAGARLQRFQLEATYITLASNVVAAAIQDALLRRQLATTENLVEAGVRALAIVQRQQSAGYASKLDVANQETALAQARQLLAPLQKQLALNRNLLRALCGSPQDSDFPEIFSLDTLRLPPELPMALPSQVIEQRPDVRAAEEQLKAISELVGVARANRLPQFSIDASAGGGARQIAGMFSPGGPFFNLAGNITAPLFDGGTLKFRERAARENLNHAAAQYQATVINAFQNVADTLQAIQSDAQALQAALTVEQSARTALSLTEKQHARGYIDRLVLLNAQRTVQQASFDVAQAQASRLGNTAALFQALGGGWQTRDRSASPRTDGITKTALQTSR
jgi:NodT family efflux transporter outer membrane factor (OMF) lipoprotein